MNSKLLLLAMAGMIVIFYSANAFAEPEANSETIIPSVFAKEDYMILDRQNYSYGDTVIMTGFIEELRDGHALIWIIVNPSGEVQSMLYGEESNGFFGSGSRIIESSWDDGIYKIIVSGAGKEFAEIFGVNYEITEDDLKQHEQEKMEGEQVKKLVESFVYVTEDTRNYVQGGLVEISGFVHLNENDQTSLDEQVTLKFFRENSRIVIHEAKVSLDKYNEFSYFLDTSDETKWEYTTQTNPPPFGTPTGFYYVVAEFADMTADDDFRLKATDEKVIDLLSMTKQATVQSSTEHIDTGNLMQTNNDDSKHPESFLEWVEDSYSPTGTSVVVRVTDPDRNKNSKATDNFNIGVYSGSVHGTPPLPVYETGKNTGIFEGMIFYTADKSSSSSNRIFVADGHRITVTYKGDSLSFKPHVIEDEPAITDNAMIKNTGVHSPYKQMKDGALSEDVLCNNSLEKIYKSNGHPACVKSSSVEKLIQRGFSLDSIYSSVN